MDAQARGFLIALGYDLLIFCSCLSFWFYIRYIRGDQRRVSDASVLQTDNRSPVASPLLSFPTLPFLSFSSGFSISSTSSSSSASSSSSSFSTRNPLRDDDFNISLPPPSVSLEAATAEFSAESAEDDRESCSCGKGGGGGGFHNENLSPSSFLVSPESTHVSASPAYRFSHLQSSEVDLPTLLPVSSSPENEREEREGTRTRRRRSRREENSWLEWIFSVMTVSDRFIECTDTQMYLNFLKISLFLLLYLSLVGILVILPMNLTTSQRHELQTFFDRAAAENLPAGSFAVWVLYLATWLYSCVCYYFIYQCWKTLKNPSIARRTAFRVEEYTVQVRGIHRSIIDSDVLKNHFAELHPGKIVAAHIVLDYSDRLRAERKLQSMLQHLITARTLHLQPSTTMITSTTSTPTASSSHVSSPSITTTFSSSSAASAASVPSTFSSTPPPMTDPPNLCIFRETSSSSSSLFSANSSSSVSSSSGAAALLSSVVSSSSTSVPLLSTTNHERRKSISWGINGNGSGRGISSALKNLYGGSSFKFDSRENDESSLPSPSLLFSSSSSSSVEGLSSQYSHSSAATIPLLSQSPSPFRNPHMPMSSNISSSSSSSSSFSSLSSPSFFLSSSSSSSPTFISSSCYPVSSSCLPSSSPSTSSSSSTTTTSASVSASIDWHPSSSVYSMTNFISRADDINYWQRRVSRECSNVTQARGRRPLRNSGVGFVSFSSIESVQECLSDPRVIGVHYDWVILPAPPPQDIIWENIHISCGFRRLRILALNFLLFIVSVLIVSPVAVLNELTPLIDSIEKTFNETNILRLTLTAWLPPLILMGVNSLLIPTLVYWVALWSGHWRKSSQTSYILHGNIIFLILNTLIIPLMSLESIAAVLKLIYKTDIQKWSISIGTFLVSSSGFFALRYLLNACFISSSSQLLQLPQLSCRGVASSLGHTTEKWAFDFGYWYANSLSIFTLIIVFSVVVPLILPLGALFFAMKYWVDKYNFAYNVWRVDLASAGAVAAVAIKYMLFSVSFLQFSMAGYFLVAQDRYMTLAGTFLFIISTVSWVLMICHSDTLFPVITPTNAKSTFATLRQDASVSAATSAAFGVPEEELSMHDLARLRVAYRHPCEEPQRPDGADSASG